MNNATRYAVQRLGNADTDPTEASIARMLALIALELDELNNTMANLEARYESATR